MLPGYDDCAPGGGVPWLTVLTTHRITGVIGMGEGPVPVPLGSVLILLGLAIEFLPLPLHMPGMAVIVVGLMLVLRNSFKARPTKSRNSITSQDCVIRPRATTTSFPISSSIASTARVISPWRARR